MELVDTQSAEDEHSVLVQVLAILRRRGLSAPHDCDRLGLQRSLSRKLRFAPKQLACLSAVFSATNTKLLTDNF